MERAVLDVVTAALVHDVSKYDLPDEIEDYLCESQTPTISGASRAFVLHNVTDPTKIPLNDDDDDLVICLGKGKKQLSDSRASQSLQFPKLKTYDNNNEVVKWILKEGERLNIDLSRIASALFVNCGSSLRKIASEVEKISVTVSKGSVVSPEEARGLMCFSAELNPQQIVDAICDGHATKALVFYDKLQEANDETGWIIAYLQRFMIQQLKLEILISRKASDEEASAALGVHPFIFKKMLMTRQSLWSKNYILGSLDRLCDLDTDHKAGRVSARFGLELEIARLAKGSNDVKR